MFAGCWGLLAVLVAPFLVAEGAPHTAKGRGDDDPADEVAKIGSRALTVLVHVENVVLEHTIALLDPSTRPSGASSGGALGEKRFGSLKGNGQEEQVVPLTARAAMALHTVVEEESESHARSNAQTRKYGSANEKLALTQDSGVMGRRYSIKGTVMMLAIFTFLEFLANDRMRRDPYGHEMALVKGPSDMPTFIQLMITSKFLKDVYSTLTIAYSTLLAVDVLRAAGIDIGRVKGAPLHLVTDRDV